MTANILPSDYRADIDGLRAVAVLLVVGFHAFPTAIPSGFMGVDIFFVISGFLISSIILNGLTNDRFSFIDFYSRRIKRIFPALLLVLTCSFIIGWFVLLPNELKQLGKHIAAGAGFGSNFVLLSESGYFDNLSETKPLLHLWSLGIEEQFYLIWPFILYFTCRKKQNFLFVIIIILVISFLLNVGKIHHHAVSVFYKPHSRFWELLIGAGLACLMMKKSSFSSLINSPLNSHNLAPQVTENVLSICGTMLLGVGYFLLTKDKRFPGWWALLPTLGAALIIAAGSKAWLNRVLLSNRFLVWIGLISFPLYLWHWPLLSFARIMQGETPSLEIRAAALMLSILLAWLTFVFIEKPIRNSSKISAVLISFMMLLGAVGYNAYSKEGHPLRENITNLTNQNSVFNWDDVKNYHESIKNDPLDLKKDVFIIGDSHAQSLFVAFSDMFKKHGSRLQFRAAAACPPFYDLVVQHFGHEEICKNNTNSLLEQIIADESIKTVILTSRGPLYLTGRGYNEAILLLIKSKYVQAKSNNDYSDVFSDAMSRTLSMLTQANKKIIYIVDAPELGFPPEKCVNTRPYKLIENVTDFCGVKKVDFLKRNASYHAIIQEQSKNFPNVKFLHLYKHLCDERFCYAKKDNIIYYRDDDHLSYEGSLILGKLLEKDIFE